MRTDPLWPYWVQVYTRNPRTGRVELGIEVRHKSAGGFSVELAAALSRLDRGHAVRVEAFGPNGGVVYAPKPPIDAAGGVG